MLLARGRLCVFCTSLITSGHDGFWRQARWTETCGNCSPLVWHCRPLLWHRSSPYWWARKNRILLSRKRRKRCTRRLGRHRRDIPVLEPQHLVVAKRFNQLAVGNERQRDGIRPRLHERLRVIDRNDEIHMPDSGPLEALNNMQRVAIRVGPFCAEPSAIAEPDALDDEHVSFPPADGIAEPCRLHFTQFRQRPSIREYLAKDHPHERFMQHHSELRRLKNLEGTACVDARHTQRQAVAIRVIDMITIPALFLNGGCPWSQLDLVRFKAVGEIVKIGHVAHIPDA